MFEVGILAANWSSLWFFFRAVGLAVIGTERRFELGTTLMRVLLRDARTGLYFQQPAHWTAESKDAQNFKHSADAMNLARKNQVEHAEVVLAFEESAYTVALPLP